MASMVSGASNVTLKRSRATAFAEEEQHIPQQSKWRISDKHVAASTAAGLNKVHENTIDRLFNASKHFWKGGTGSATTAISSNNANGTAAGEHMLENSSYGGQCNVGQNSITQYFSCCSNRSTDTNLMDTDMDTDSLSTVHAEAQSSLFAFGAPSGNGTIFKFHGNERSCNERLNRKPQTCQVTVTTPRQLTLNKFGGFAGSFIPGNLDSEQTARSDGCRGCASVQGSVTHRGDPCYTCHYCDALHCQDCLNSCCNCANRYCSHCCINSFQQKENGAVCFKCLA